MESSRHTNTPRHLLAYHDKLLYMLAYPENREQYEKNESALLQVTERFKEKLSANNRRFRALLQGSGIEGSVITGSFSYEICHWLVQLFPGDTEIDSCHADPETIRLFFRALLPRAEYENISAGELSLLKRIKKLKGDTTGSALQWMLELLNKSGLPCRVRESLFHTLQLFISWKLTSPLYNRTQLRGPAQAPFYHQAIIRQGDAKKIITKKIPAPKKISEADKKHFINTARATLAFLYRETEPFTYADFNEITCFGLERGLTILLYGMNPERRLSIESYIGYKLFKNGIPLAYGGGWIFGHRCQFGINILPPFRGGESALLFYQLLRVYKQFFRIEEFVVKPYQFGKNNTEALRSGAFWFYYKAGFRPADTTLMLLAEREWLMKGKDKKYRTPVHLLKQLTGANLSLRFNKSKAPFFDAALVSRKISSFINGAFNGERDKAIIVCEKQTKKQLGLSSLHNWNHFERKAFKEWSLLIQSSLDISKWNQRDKGRLTRLIRSKGTLHERKFILLLQQQEHFWKELAAKYLHEKI